MSSSQYAANNNTSAFRIFPRRKFSHAKNKFSNPITRSKSLGPPPNDLTKWLTGFAGEEFGLVHTLYEFYKIIHNDCKKFPKTERHALGETIKTQIIALIDGVWEANALPPPQRLQLLEKLQRTLDLVKIFVRLVYDLDIYSINGYLHRQKELKKIGGMLGVWKKTTRKKIGLDP